MEGQGFEFLGYRFEAGKRCAQAKESSGIHGQGARENQTLTRRESEQMFMSVRCEMLRGGLCNTQALR